MQAPVNISMWCSIKGEGTAPPTWYNTFQGLRTVERLLLVGPMVVPPRLSSCMAVLPIMMPFAALYLSIRGAEKGGR